MCYIKDLFLTKNNVKNRSDFDCLKVLCFLFLKKSEFIAEIGKNDDEIFRYIHTEEGNRKHNSSILAQNYFFFQVGIVL